MKYIKTHILGVHEFSLPSYVVLHLTTISKKIYELVSKDPSSYFLCPLLG